MVDSQADFANDPSPKAQLAWWFWFAYLGRQDGDTAHVYGCAAETDKAAGFHSSRTVKLPSTARLEIRQYVVTADAAREVLDLLEQGVIDLSALDEEAPGTGVLAARAILARGFGNDATRMRAYTGDARPGEIFPDPQEIAAVLRELHEELNLDFRKSFINHIGGFDVIDAPIAFDNENRFVVAALSANANEGTDAVLIARRGSTDCALSAHIIVSDASNDVMLNRLVPLPIGVAELNLPVPRSIYGLKVSIFDTDGDVLHEVDQQYFRSIHSVMNVVTSTVQIDDKLTQRAKGKGRAKAAQASGAARVTRQQSIFAADHAPVADRLTAMSTYLAAMLDGHSRDRWFARTFDDELDVIAHFNWLLGDPDIEAAFIVDPFINGESVMRLLRLNCTGLTLSVVMSWSGTDADTGDPLDEKQSRARLDQLRQTLDQAGPFMGPAVTVLNVTDQQGKQAFHDRYFMTRSRTGDVAVYLLSNSLNGLAKNWPFCMSELTGAAKSKVARYITGLNNGRDIADDEPLRTTFAWPPQGA
ncbi:VPA1262 family N-terminal domain-containing protein [Sphingomonas sp. HMP6]|uniref:VPA1262 family N-terminal domain-containing protein n=1 Tax=Sphingomonas sp. HMP6 TaxID=1517551 RepID=UPI0015964A73|nr:VPA1262 family N-terminal domain-containing protein [Sphingomonas sp. HMP6]BCA58143.1 hypothetical protein HMP06_0912 [Sphingomonas sp. HMP6]